MKSNEYLQIDTRLPRWHNSLHRLSVRSLIAGATLFILVGSLSGCNGSAPQPAGKQSGSSAVPRLTPPPAKPAPQLDSEPDKPPPAPPARHPVGPWLEYRVANSDLITGQAYLRFLQTPGFDSVLELTSSSSPDREEFPSLYVRAAVAGSSLAALVRRELSADCYLMVEQGGDVIHNRSNQPVVLVVTEIDGKNVRGTFTGQVHDIDLGGDGLISGKFQAVIE